MAAAYDNYDYPSYWQGREYEHQSDVIALKSLLDQIPAIRALLEVGVVACGFAHQLVIAADVETLLHRARFHES